MNSWSEQDRSVESFILNVAFMFFFPEWKGEQSEHPFKSHYSYHANLALSFSDFLTHNSLQSVYWMESTWTRVSVLFSDLSFTAQRWPFLSFSFFIHSFIDSFSMWAIQLQKRWKKIEYFSPMYWTIFNIQNIYWIIFWKIKYLIYKRCN